MKSVYIVGVLYAMTLPGCTSADDRSQRVGQTVKSLDGAPEITMELVLDAAPEMDLDRIRHHPKECPKLEGAYQSSEFPGSEPSRFRTVNNTLEVYTLGSEPSWDRVDGQVYLLKQLNRSGQTGDKFWRSAGCSNGAVYFRHSYAVESGIAKWVGSIKVQSDGSYLESWVHVTPSSSGVAPFVSGPTMSRYLPMPK